MSNSNGPPPNEPPLKAYYLTGTGSVRRLQQCRLSHAFNIKHYKKGGDIGPHNAALSYAIQMLGFDSTKGSEPEDVAYERVGDFTEDLIYQFKKAYYIWDEARGQTAPDKVCGVWTIGWLDEALLARERESEQEEADSASVKAAPGKKSLVRASPMVMHSMLKQGR